MVVVVVFDPPLFRLANFKRPDLRLDVIDDDDVMVIGVFGDGIDVVAVRLSIFIRNIYSYDVLLSSCVCSIS